MSGSVTSARATAGEGVAEPFERLRREAEVRRVRLGAGEELVFDDVHDEDLAARGRRHEGRVIGDAEITLQPDDVHGRFDARRRGLVAPRLAA